MRGRPPQVSGVLTMPSPGMLGLPLFDEQQILSANFLRLVRGAHTAAPVWVPAERGESPLAEELSLPRGGRWADPWEGEQFPV